MKTWNPGAIAWALFACTAGVYADADVPSEAATSAARRGLTAYYSFDEGEGETVPLYADALVHRRSSTRVSPKPSHFF